MKSLLSPLICGVGLMAALECGAAEADMPDCVGIRPGMALTEARERLKAYDPQLEVGAIELQIPSLAEKPVLEMLFVARPPTLRSITPRSITNNASVVVPTSGSVETVQAEITLPPNKPVVWKVVRSLRFQAGQEQTRTALFTALTEKYGKESLTIDQGVGKISRYWVRSPQGKLLEGQAANECSTFFQSYRNYFLDSVLRPSIGGGGKSEFIGKLATIVYMAGFDQPRQPHPPHPIPTRPEHLAVDQPRTTPEDQQECQTMTYVIAELSVAENREIVNDIQVTVVDAGLDMRSKEATRSLIKQSETAAEKQRVERAKQQPAPKL